MREMAGEVSVGGCRRAGRRSCVSVVAAMGKKSLKTNYLENGTGSRPRHFHRKTKALHIPGSPRGLRAVVVAAAFCPRSLEMMFWETRFIGCTSPITT